MELGEDPSDQAVSALGDGDLDPRVVAVGGVDDAHLGRGGGAVVELDAALLDGAQLLGRRPAVDLGEVALGHPGAGVREAVRQLAVVGEQQGALGVVVEPPDGLDPGRGILEQVEDAPAALGVVASSDAALGLVHQQVDRARRGRQRSAVDPHDVDLGVDLHQLVDHLAVHAHPAVEDHRLRRAPRGHAAGGEELRQSDAAGVGVRHRRRLIW